MNKGIKIFVGVVVFLGILSGVFLLFAKNKNQTSSGAQNIQVQKKPVPVPKNSTVVPDLNKTTSLPESTPLKTKEPEKKVSDRKVVIRAEWTKCKAKTLSAETKLLWNVQITEEIPAGGTYAKGNLDNDTSFPVRVIIKPGIQTVEKVKSMLVLGKMAFLRGTCTDVAPDGSVVLQVF